MRLGSSRPPDITFHLEVSKADPSRWVWVLYRTDAPQVRRWSEGDYPTQADAWAAGEVARSIEKTRGLG